MIEFDCITEEESELVQLQTLLYDMLVAMLTCLCPPELLNLLNIMRTVELSDSLNRVQRSS